MHVACEGVPPRVLCGWLPRAASASQPQECHRQLGSKLTPCVTAACWHSCRNSRLRCSSSGSASVWGNGT